MEDGTVEHNCTSQYTGLHAAMYIPQTITHNSNFSTVTKTSGILVSLTPVREECVYKDYSVVCILMHKYVYKADVSSALHNLQVFDSTQDCHTYCSWNHYHLWYTD